MTAARLHLVPTAICYICHGDAVAAAIPRKTDRSSRHGSARFSASTSTTATASVATRSPRTIRLSAPRTHCPRFTLMGSATSGDLHLIAAVGSCGAADVGQNLWKKSISSSAAGTLAGANAKVSIRSASRASVRTARWSNRSGSTTTMSASRSPAALSIAARRCQNSRECMCTLTM